MREQSLQYLTSLVAAASPSGFEKATADLYRHYVRQAVDRIETDLLGNCTAIIHPDAPMRIMLSGHMDEVGFLIHFIDERGLLYFKPIGGQDSPTPMGQKLWIYGRERIAGVVGRKAIHLLEPNERSAKPSMDELWIDIGASSRQQAEKFVRLGGYATYQYELTTLADDCVTGRALDNKAGLFVVSEALRLLATEGGLHPDVGVFALGTVQEEIGSRGASTAPVHIHPQSGLAIDMEHALDYPGIVPSTHGVSKVGGGPTVSKGPNSSPIVNALLEQVAQAEGIPLQFQIAAAATPTDEKAMQVSAGGFATGLVGAPLRYMHTPTEVVCLTDLEQCARLVAGYCRAVQPDTDFRPF